MEDGLIVIVVVLVPVTLLEVTLIVSRTESSDDFLMVILPVSTTISSLKVRTILALMSTPVAPSDGEEEDKIGAVESGGELHVMKFPPLVSEVPPTVILELAVSHVPEVMVKLLSMSIAFVACVAEVPLRTTL